MVDSLQGGSVQGTIDRLRSMEQRRNKHDARQREMSARDAHLITLVLQRAANTTPRHTSVIQHEELALLCFIHDIVKNPGRVDRPRSAEPHSPLARAMTSHARIEHARARARANTRQLSLINRAHTRRGTRHSKNKPLESSIS
jgi:hypothetical protein